MIAGNATLHQVVNRNVLRSFKNCCSISIDLTEVRILSTSVSPHSMEFEFKYPFGSELFIVYLVEVWPLFWG
jgi:hypothetical protein